MNDLVSMLKDAGMGIGKASEMINCLLMILYSLIKQKKNNSHY